MKKYILSIDQGTTSSRAILFNKSAHMVAIAQKEIPLIYPKAGYVEVDALKIWLSVIDVINELLVKSNSTFDDIDCIGITNQRETTVLFDKSGMPLSNAIVWQSRQSLEICEERRDKEQLIYEKTGLRLNPYFSASKIRYLLDHIENGQARAKKGEILFGTIDTWLIYKLSNGESFVTDVSNASRTLLYNIHNNEWDDELLKLFNIPKIMLPRVQASSGYFAKAKFFRVNTPITGVAGDQQASLFGHACFKKGEYKNTYGTGCFMLLNTGNEIVNSKNGLLSTVAWKIGDEVTYALEGSVFVGGAAVSWLRDQLKIIKTPDETESKANLARNDNELYFVPAFVGLGTPYWDDDVRGAIFGLTRDSSQLEIIKATLESIAYQCYEVIKTMEDEINFELGDLKVDGGASKNNYILQFQSDLLNATLKKPSCVEVTALGVAYLAGLATGYFKNLDEILKLHSYEKIITPKMDEATRIHKIKGWKSAIKAAISFKEGK